MPCHAAAGLASDCEHEHARLGRRRIGSLSPPVSLPSQDARSRAADRKSRHVAASRPTRLPQVAKAQRARNKQNKQSTIAFIEQARVAGGEARDSTQLDSIGAARRAGAAEPEPEACPREEKGGRQGGPAEDAGEGAGSMAGGTLRVCALAAAAVLAAQQSRAEATTSTTAAGVLVSCAVNASESTPIEVASAEQLSELCSAACELQLDDEQEVGEADEAGEEDQDRNREDNVPLAFGLVIAAGLSTSVGAAFVFCDGVVTRANRFVLAGSLGFSAGVMLYVSLVEIFVKAVDEFVACECLWEHENPLAPARIMTTIVFFLGLLFFLCLDAGIHHIQHLSSLRSAKGDKGNHVESSSTSTSTGIARPTDTWRSGSSPGRTEMASNDDAKECPSPSPASGGTRENADSELVELAIMDAAPSCPEGNPEQIDLELAERHKQMRAAAPPSVRFTSMNEDDSGDVSIEQAARIGLERFGASDEVMAENNPVSVCEHSTQQATEGDAQKRNAESLRRRRRELEELAREHCSHGHGHGQNHGHGHGDRAVAHDEHDEEKLRSMGLMTAIAIGLHNFPEGLATFVATLADPTVGVGLAVAIAVHNIPEGLCVSIPIYYSTGNRVRGFLLATISGFAEIVGAFLGWAALASTFSSEAYASLFALVSGMMVAIVMKELIPTAHRYDPQDRITTVTIFMGMAIMAVSLCLFLL